MSSLRICILGFGMSLFVAFSAHADLRFSTAPQRIPAQFCSDLVQLQTQANVSTSVPVYLLGNVAVYSDAKCMVPLVDPTIAPGSNVLKFYFRGEVVGWSWIWALSSLGFPMQVGTIVQPRLVGTDSVISNGSFEDVLEVGALRPPFWYIGTPGAPLTTGSWSVDAAESTDGGHSLRLNPSGQYYASQILHVPGTGLAGKTITFHLKVKHQGLSSPPVILMHAVNPEITTVDPIFGAPGFSASTAVVADATEGIWHDVTGSIVSSTETLAVAITLAASSPSGSAWFDQVTIDAPRWNPQFVKPFTSHLPISTRNFDMGFTGNAPMDSSDRGFENLIYLAKTTGNMVNVFVPIQWCRLAANPVPCESDPKHQQIVEMVQYAKSRGLKIGLTFNFTHASAGSVGDLNRLPDGSSPGTMLDSNVRDAMKAELLWLYREIQPTYIMTGIEMNIMQRLHPSWWAPFVTMHGEIYDAIKALDPTSHVTTYFTHEWAVDSQGNLDPASVATWRMLLPKLDSIAFSSYPAGHFQNLAPENYPVGYFSKPSEIAPDLPIMLAEFGVDGGIGSGLTERQQAELLQRMIGEFAAVNPVALVYYQPFDMNYLGQPKWFKDFWSTIGLARLDGTAKDSYFVWSDLFRLGTITLDDKPQ